MIDSQLKNFADQLIGIQRHLTNFDGDDIELRRLQGMLVKIDNSRVNGIFYPPSLDGNLIQEILPGQAELNELLAECFNLVRVLVEAPEHELAPELSHIRKDLEHILKSLGTLKPQDRTHLCCLQGRLNAIDSARQDGTFGPLPALPGQEILNELLVEGYNKVHALYEAQPASPAG
eukprot:TRINITY_DN19522_c0_g1_i1.p1 TRINITY_DN19522_c0_g1~~TRINITY_DN19522_c0_g1_i1.p1  ORF type:complete len:176 (+),score=27.62 TRINITY_DN19522_c0_g1_i1:57-584(+)